MSAGGWRADTREGINMKIKDNSMAISTGGMGEELKTGRG
jgi:hypothetical protein